MKFHNRGRKQKQYEPIVVPLKNESKAQICIGWTKCECMLVNSEILSFPLSNISLQSQMIVTFSPTFFQFKPVAFSQMWADPGLFLSQLLLLLPLPPSYINLSLSTSPIQKLAKETQNLFGSLSFPYPYISPNPTVRFPNSTPRGPVRCFFVRTVSVDCLRNDVVSPKRELQDRGPPQPVQGGGGRGRRSETTRGHDGGDPQEPQRREFAEEEARRIPTSADTCVRSL